MLPEMSLKYRNDPSTVGVEDTEPNPGLIVPVSAAVKYSQASRKLPTLFLSIGPPRKLRVFWISTSWDHNPGLALTETIAAQSKSELNLTLKILTSFLLAKIQFARTLRS